jgi:nucleoside 2-deoxyribosyltransferase
VKVYFAGSIRAGRDDAPTYARLVAHLRTRSEVLTEHVATPADGDAGDSDIWEQDMAWLREADAVVAEVTVPSLGVGYELGMAEALGIPVLCLFRTGAAVTLSAMVGGNPRFEVARYADVAEACSRIDGFLDAVDG